MQAAGSRRKRIRVDYNLLASSGRSGQGSSEQNEHAELIAKLQAEVEEAKKKEAEMSNDVVAKEGALSVFSANLKSHADFMALGISCVTPAFNYYKKIFNTEGGDSFAMKCALRAMTMTVFNPLKLRNISISTAELLIDDLSFLEFPEFTDEFFEGMKKELPSIRDEARKQFNWDAVPGAEDYNNSQERDVDPPDPRGVSTREVHFRTWQDDIGEKGRRIWEWWKVRMVGSSKWPRWSLALRLCVLVQPSSAAIERVFSQLKLIVDAIGTNELEETLEYRMFKRVNQRT